MSERAAIGEVLGRAGITVPIIAAAPLSGGCIHRVLLVTLQDERRLVVKVNDASAASLLQEESRSLLALAESGAVVVPRPLGCDVASEIAVLVMTEVPSAPPTEASWRRLGSDLAALHQVEAGPRYGFDADNHLGATAQPNGWCDDWIEFNATRRLGHQLELARGGDRLSSGQARSVERVIQRLDRLIPARPRPALLHGDLWSGNALPTEGGRVALIDPACSVGDGWADIAMMKLFGGFSDACFATYADAVEDHDEVDRRIAVYQLYHLLNHVNLFGSGYVGQTMSVVGRLLR